MKFKNPSLFAIFRESFKYNFRSLIIYMIFAFFFLIVGIPVFLLLGDLIFEGTSKFMTFENFKIILIGTAITCLAFVIYAFIPALYATVMSSRVRDWVYLNENSFYGFAKRFLITTSGIGMSSSIKSWSNLQSYEFEIINGVTFCVCHFKHYRTSPEGAGDSYVYETLRIPFTGNCSEESLERIRRLLGGFKNKSQKMR